MRRYIIMALALFWGMACAQIELTEPEKEESSLGNIEKIHATIEDDGTRVQLNSKVQTVWNRGDEIIAFQPGGLVYWYQFKGNTGARSGELHKYAQSGFSTDPGFDRNYALYPAGAFMAVAYVGNELALLADFPSVQKYIKDSYGIGSNILVASSDDPDEYRFRNMSAFLRLNLTGSKKVSEITLKGNGSEILAGSFYYLLSDMLNYSWYEASSYELKLDCGNGVQLGDAPVAFHFSLMPVKFSKGITVTITFTDGTQVVKRTSKAVELSRNDLLPMAVVDTGTADWHTIEIEHSTDSFEIPVLSGGTSLVGFIHWGDGNQSALGEWSGTYLYWDNLSSHTVTVKSDGAYLVEFPSLRGVSEINFSNF